MGLCQELECFLMMGLCLDTGYSHKGLALDDFRQEKGTTSLDRIHKEARTGALLGCSSIALDTGIQSTSVIFFMGGPCSGRASNAQNLADLHDRYRHINMIAILNEHSREFVLRQNEPITPAVALALLARELNTHSKMRSFLISGYPRHTSDMELYVEKLGKPTGAILLEWHKSTLIRNIELGRLRDITDNFDGYDDMADEYHCIATDAARKELSEFYAKVLPVCDRLDAWGLLYVVSGDRSQEKIFKDIQKAHHRIIASHQFIPGSINGMVSYREYRQMMPFFSINDVQKESEDSGSVCESDIQTDNNIPPCLFVMGGPGSNKGKLVNDISYLYPGWAIVNISSLLSSLIKSGKTGHCIDEELSFEQLDLIQNLISKGDLISQDLMIAILHNHLSTMGDKEGIIIIGFPRDINQVRKFEEKFGQVPPLVLVDCSELELGRNLGRRGTRIDDNIEAAYRRLGIYREITLPMLKAFDEKNRMTIVDGDSDSDQVLKDLKRAIYEETQMLSNKDSSLRYFQNLTSHTIFESKTTTVQFEESKITRVQFEESPNEFMD